MKIKALLAIAMFLGSGSIFAHGNLADVVARGDRDHALEMIGEDTNVNAIQSDGTSALIYAAHQGDAELVKALIEAGAEVSHTNEYGAFALSEAAITESTDVIALLLDNGANADQRNPEGETALLVAARTNNIEAAELLLDHGADVNAKETWGGQSPLMWASAQQHPEMMQFLIDHGADINEKSSARIWDRRITSEPRPKDMNKGGFSPLHYAARQGCIECIAVLAKAGADLDAIDPDRVTPLNLALINSHYDTAAALIEAGADVDKWDLFGRTPLFNAIDLNTTPTGGRTDIPSDDALDGVDISAMLLEHGANPNIQLKLRPPYRNVPFDRGADNVLSTGATPLMRAARAADNAAVEVLLAHGALVDLPNAQGVTPLMVVSGVEYPQNPTRGRYKTETDSIETIRLLLEAGANINALTGDPSKRPDTEIQSVQGEFIFRGGPGMGSGQTALHGAAKVGWTQIAKYLIENGAVQQVEDSTGRTPIDYAMGRFPAAYLAAAPEPFPETVMLLQEMCLAADNCSLSEIIDFSNPNETQ